ncbi:MAG: putative peptidoglycan glycosyltransferase FtsW [Candidatus Paceibacterota bacterium]
MKKSADPIILGIVLLLVVVGFFIFSSASLGLLARSGVSFSSVAFNQVIFGIIGGLIAMFLGSQIYYRNWRQYAFYIFIATLAITLLVFVPGLGQSYGGATRWIEIGGFSFQPAEFLKYGFIIYMATWLSGMREHTSSFLKGTLPFCGFVSVIGVIMLLQPDTDTFLIICTAAVTMFIVAGGRWRDVGAMVIAGILLIVILAFMRPYVMDRFTSFMNPSDDPLGSGWQIQQSLIAVGSGGITGRGYGQSIQKFEYLPEPIGDSIFAVFAEEFGFIGSFILILLLASFTFRGYRLATHAQDQFGMLLVVGIITLIVVQAFLNIAAMVSLAPMLGLPLPLISHGGTALLATLGAIGIILNISKYQKRKI